MCFVAQGGSSSNFEHNVFEFLKVFEMTQRHIITRNSLNLERDLLCSWTKLVIDEDSYGDHFR
jgi:hypothetical protein